MNDPASMPDLGDRQERPMRYVVKLKIIGDNERIIEYPVFTYLYRDKAVLIAAIQYLSFDKLPGDKLYDIRATEIGPAEPLSLSELQTVLHSHLEM